ncbi:MAG: hypothetical protein ACLR8P_07750 [Clostridium fessum]
MRKTKKLAALMLAGAMAASLSSLRRTDSKYGHDSSGVRRRRRKQRGRADSRRRDL